MESSEADPVWDMAATMFNTTDSLCSDICNKFQDEVQDMLVQKHKLCSEAEAPLKKRKLKSIIEDESLDGIKKKNRPSKIDEVDHSFANVHSKSNTSTPTDKSILQAINIDISKDITAPVTDSDQGVRSKRGASMKATSINNKLLNLKMNEKMRRTSLSKSNVYDEIIESDKENFQEILQTNQTVNLTKSVDAPMSDENKTITPKLSKKSSKGVVDDNLMPPPKLPTKKKRGAKANKNETHDDFDSESNTEKPTRNKRAKKVHETSVENTNETIKSTTNQRLTRSQARNMSTSVISDVTVVMPKTARNKTISKSIEKNTDIDEKSEPITSIDIKKTPENKLDQTYNKPSVEDSPKNLTYSLVMKDGQCISEDNSIVDPLSQVGQETKYLQEIDDTFNNVAISTCQPLLSSTLAIDNHAIEMMKNQKNAFEHTEEKIETSKVSKVSTEENVHSKNANFDQTIILPPKNNPTHTTVNETIVLSKENEDSFNESRSFLEDDLSEVEETPSKLPKPLLKIHMGKNKNFESPVKSCVKHFEKLAEMYKMNTNSGAAGSNMLTRKKSRTGTSKLPIQELADNLSKKKIVDNKTDLTNHKNLSPPDKKVHGKGSHCVSTNQAKQEQWRKRDEKLRAAALAREAQEKLKQAHFEKAERERQEKIRLFQLEKEEKLKEEARKIKEKKLAQQQRIAEIEEKRKQEELARKLHLAEQREEMTKKHYLEKLVSDFNRMIQEEEEIENDEENNKSERDKRALREKRKPDWAKSENLDKLISSQSFILPSVIDEFYQVDKFVPNLLEIFPGIKSTKLQRNSSAVWKTPPRCSMMPKIYE